MQTTTVCTEMDTKYIQFRKSVRPLHSTFLIFTFNYFHITCALRITFKYEKILIDDENIDLA
jgi:hypothetical protein